MRYIDINGGSQYPYPNHDINPDKKDMGWCMQYAKASYWDWSYAYPKGVFSNNAGDYQKWRMYALGKQPITPYKKWLGVDQETNNTWLVIDWTVRAIISGYRDRSISRMMKEDYGIVCTPIDILAHTELTSYYSEMKAKLMVRDLMLQKNPQLASHPLIKLQSGEPLDIEELGMRVEMGEQFNRAKDAELAIELGFYENNYKAFRRSIFEDLFDYGVAGVKDYLGDDNKPKFRRVNPDSTITNYCKDATFSDLIHGGELIDVSLMDLATVTDKDGNLCFDEQELQEFASSIAGKFGNPAIIGATNGWLKPYDKFKCKVFDIEFFTYNDYSYNDAYDENGNSDFRKAANGRGKKSDKYKRKKIQYVYKCKWIVGTEHCYDWGMAYDQKRSTDVKKKAKTKLSYHFCAYNFYEMKAQSFMERLVPYLDDYQLTMLKIQNFKNRAVPSGWWIDLDALENVALSKGGAAMQPKELLQMFFETGVLVGRSKDAAGQPMGQNWKPVIPIENTAASELAMFYQDLLSIISAIEKMTGFNEITNGNPDPKTLVPGYEMANTSTQDALFPMMWAEENLSLELAYNVLCRTQQGIKKGGISGFAPAINSNTLRFIEINPDISFREYGIELQKRTTDDQKTWLLQQMQSDIQNGFLDSSDAVTLVNTHNAKEAQMIWAYRVKKAKETAHNQQMQIQQQQVDGNKQIAQQTQMAQQQTLQMELQAKIKLNQDTIAGEIQKEQLRIASAERIALQNNLTDIQVAADTGDAKENAAVITAHAKVVSTDLAGKHATNKQEVANDKPIANSK